jgi:uncharacterized membrane protein (UPF0127 family)
MKILIDCIVIVALILAGYFVYDQYGVAIKNTFFSEHHYNTLYVGKTPVNVTVADDDAERKQGLGGIRELGEKEGKLFIFEKSARHGFWMKDMIIPIDIIWVDDNLKVVFIAENVQPDTYPSIYAPTSDARFVLETNAHFVSSFRVSVGDLVTLPSNLLPDDVKNTLR